MRNLGIQLHHHEDCQLFQAKFNSECCVFLHNIALLLLFSYQRIEPFCLVHLVFLQSPSLREDGTNTGPSNTSHIRGQESVCAGVMQDLLANDLEISLPARK